MPGTLEFDGLSRRFGPVTALDDLSFSVPSGQVVGFLGPNGAGKTTTMRAVFGLTDLDAGSVRWNGAPIGSAQRRRFGYMPEERGLYPNMLVADQLEYLGRLHGMDSHSAAVATKQWLERLDVADRSASKVETLSHGNQQRVQLAAALVHDPELLVLDEPLSGLDPTGIDAIGQVLVEQAHSGRCVLFSSHQLDLVEDLCESVAIIDGGRLVARGTVDDLATSGGRRLAVRVEGDRQGIWAQGLPGVVVSEIDGGEVRLVLGDSTDSDVVLDAARAGWARHVLHLRAPSPVRGLPGSRGTVKALPFVLAAAAVILVVRNVLRRRGRGRQPPVGEETRRRRDRRLFGDTGIVAGREIRERVRGRVFRVVTLILFAVVAAAVIIPTINTGTASRLRVGVVAGSPALDNELQKLASTVGVAAELVRESEPGDARTALNSGHLDIVVDGSGTILVENPISDGDTSAAARYVRAVSTALGVQQAFDRAGLTPEQAGAVAGASPWPVDSVHPSKAATTTAEATALLGIILIFIVLNQYLSWILMGVMEEKASRVIEVLLATVRPGQLLAGKVVGIGAAALVQAVSLVVFALVLAKVVGANLVHGTAPVVVGAILVWLVLGYAFYSWVYAAAGSLAERQDQVQSLVLPLSVPLIFGYIVSLIGVSSGSASLLVKVLAYLPPTAPFAMPTLVGFGEVTWWQFLFSVVVTVVCTVLVARVAARVYRTAVLRTGGRVRLRELLPYLS